MEAIATTPPAGRTKKRWNQNLTQQSLTREAELEMIRAFQAGDLDAGSALITAHQSLIGSMVQRYLQYGCPQEDLRAEANLGLCEAMRKFDAAKGTRLGTYAVWWIKQHIRTALTENSRTIRIPVYQQHAVRDIHAAAAKLTEITGQYPTDEEIAFETKLPIARVQNLKNLTMPMMSLQAPVGSTDDGRTFEDILSDTSGAGESPLDILSRKNSGETLLALIERRLSAIEREVIKARFGFTTGVTQTLEEVGKTLKLTRERIRQIQESGIKKLRRTLTAEAMQETTLLSLPR